MQQNFFKQLLIIGIFCLTTVVFAASDIDTQIKDINTQITTASSEQTTLLNRSTQISADIKTNEKEKRALEMQLKQWALTTKKLHILSDEGNQKAQLELKQMQYETKRAQFNLDKIIENNKQLQKDLDDTRKQKRILKTQLDTLHAELVDLKAQQTHPTPAKLQ